MAGSSLNQPSIFYPIEMVNTSVMAIIQNKENEGLRFGKMQNLYQESMVQENYMSDAIKSYGQDIRYYKLKSFYPEIFKPILDTNNLSIHAYGEEFAQEWEDPVKMIGYIKFDDDGFVIKPLGVQPESNLTMWLNQTDFAIALARKLSQWREYKCVGRNEFILDFDSNEDLIKNKKNIMMEFQTDLFNGSLQAVLTDNTLNQLLIHDHCPKLETPIRIPCNILEHGDLKIDTGRVNPLLFKGDHYDPFESDMIDCHLCLEVESIIKDMHGCIRMMGGIAGGVIYHDTQVIGKYLDNVGPEVGDLIDIVVNEQPNGQTGIYGYNKYEVVNVNSNAANQNYMNPFLRNYIYECTLRDYIPSGQKEPGGQAIEEIEVKDKLDLINTAADDAAKKLSVYEDFEDDVYGGYGKINKRQAPSVQRDASTSTINNFDPPKKTKGMRKTIKHLFAFRDWKMMLSLVDDPKNNNSFLKLSPLNKTKKVAEDTNYLDYLRCDDDTMCLVNGTQAYLLASRFNTPDFDEETFCVKPIRLKHQVYAQHNGWADQPFHLVDADDENKLSMDLQDLIGANTTPSYKSASENRITFPYSNTFLEVEYEKLEDGSELWTCYVQFKADANNVHYPLCSFRK